MQYDFRDVEALDGTSESLSCINTGAARADIGGSRERLPWYMDSCKNT